MSYNLNKNPMMFSRKYMQKVVNRFKKFDLSVALKTSSTRQRC